MNKTVKINGTTYEQVVLPVPRNYDYLCWFCDIYNNEGTGACPPVFKEDQQCRYIYDEDTNGKEHGKTVKMRLFKAVDPLYDDLLKVKELSDEQNT